MDNNTYNVYIKVEGGDCLYHKIKKSCCEKSIEAEERRRDQILHINYVGSSKCFSEIAVSETQATTAYSTAYVNKAGLGMSGCLTR